MKLWLPSILISASIAIGIIYWISQSFSLKEIGFTVALTTLVIFILASRRRIGRMG